MGIYLDHNASTPIAPGVAAAIRAATEGPFGNPSAAHWAGRPARERLEAARARLAALLGCAPYEIVLTSGGSEANNLILKGVFERAGVARPHFVTSAVEHPAITQPLAWLERRGARVTRLPVDGHGRVAPADLEAALGPETVLVSLMHANNETGTLQPVAECAALARAAGVPVHTDAAQTVGKVTTRVDELGVDALSVAGHKFHAPKGVGALYVREGLDLEPLIHGAGHERGRRAGTESVLLAEALAAACDLARGQADAEHVRALRDHFWRRLREAFGANVVRNGHPEHCLPNTLNVAFPGRRGADILEGLGDVAASTGSACHADRVELSPVLAAMGVPEHVGMGAIRFSLGRGNTQAEIDTVVERLSQMV